jgi:riboflavin kinase/FMN adenylyltransferase
MKLIRGLHNLVSSSCELKQTGCVGTVGNFDGVHLGHQKVIKQVLKQACLRQVPSVVMVFEPQPQEFFLKDQAPPRLMSFREKLSALARLGVDYVVALQFNVRLRSLSAEGFIQHILMDGLNIKHLVIGDDFRFGCDRSGDFELLQNWGAKAGFSVEPTDSHLIDNQRVSSTRIRELLTKDALDEAEKLLGHRYSISGGVMHGQKLGRQIGVPTANLFLGRIRPVLVGVYVVKVLMPDGQILKGVANLGRRPTVEGDNPVLEVHLLNFKDDLYGQHLNVCFLKKLRKEQKFESLDALKTQIFRDIEDAKSYFDRYPDSLYQTLNG